MVNIHYLAALLFVAAAIAIETTDANDSAVSCDDTHCSCVNDGRDLGFKTPSNAKVTKHCECAVAQDNFAQTGMVGQTFSCDEYGNYAPVQCRGSVCYCANSKGDNLGFNSPIGQADAKNCKCALDKHEHQLTGKLGKTFSCDEVGNYKAVNCIGSICHCVSPDGKNLGYKTPIHQLADKTCQCALDKHANSKLGVIGKSFSCDKHGNYKPVRCIGSVCFCVDAFGKKTSNSTASIGKQKGLNC